MRCLLILLLLCFLLQPSRVVSENPKKNIQLYVSLDSKTTTELVNNSFIIINNIVLPDSSSNNSVQVNLSVYRGKTLKKTVYVWLEDADKARLSEKLKFSVPKQFTYLNQTLNLSLNHCSSSTPYLLVVEGLGINITKPIATLPENCTVAPAISEPIDSKISFEILSYETELYSNSSFKTRILIKNPTKENTAFTVWSYVYRSSKCYSGEREENKKTINVPEFSNITFDLENTVTAQPGNYTLKVLLLHSNKKTPEEFKIPVTVYSTAAISDFAQEKSDAQENSKSPVLIKDETSQEKTNLTSKRKLFSPITSFSVLNETAPKLVYESASARARGLLVYLLIATLLLILIVLILKRL